MVTQQFYDFMKSANSEQKELLMHIISHLHIFTTSNFFPRTRRQWQDFYNKTYNGN